MFRLGPGDDLLLATPRDTVVANTVASMHRKQGETPVNPATLLQPRSQFWLDLSELCARRTCQICGGYPDILHVYACAIVGILSLPHGTMIQRTVLCGLPLSWLNLGFSEENSSPPQACARYKLKEAGAFLIRFETMDDFTPSAMIQAEYTPSSPQHGLRERYITRHPETSKTLPPFHLNLINA